MKINFKLILSVSLLTSLNVGDVFAQQDLNCKYLKVQEKILECLDRSHIRLTKEITVAKAKLELATVEKALNNPSKDMPAQKENKTSLPTPNSTNDSKNPKPIKVKFNILQLISTTQIAGKWRLTFKMPNGRMTTAGLGDMLPDGSKVIGGKLGGALLLKNNIQYKVGINQ